MKKIVFKFAFVIASFTIDYYSSGQQHTTGIKSAAATIQLPPGFTATIVTDSLVGARHLAVNKQGGVYVKLSKLRDGKGIIYLKDVDGSGKFVEQKAFGDYPGTGISIKNDYLYASSNDDVYRYKL